MKRYPKMREVIHDGSKPPKLGSYTPPKPYLLERIEGATLGRMGSVAGEREGAAQPDGTTSHSTRLPNNASQVAGYDRLGGRG